MLLTNNELTQYSSHILLLCLVAAEEVVASATTNVFTPMLVEVLELLVCTGDVGSKRKPRAECSSPEGTTITIDCIPCLHANRLIGGDVLIGVEEAGDSLIKLNRQKVEGR